MYVLSRIIKNIKVFYLKIFSVLEVKFSIYLNRRVFVMYKSNTFNSFAFSVFSFWFTIPELPIYKWAWNITVLWDHLLWHRLKIYYKSSNNIVIQSTLVISKSEEISKILRDIRFAELRKKIIEQPHFTNEYVIWLLQVRDISKILWKRGETVPLFHNML